MGLPGRWLTNGLAARTWKVEQYDQDFKSPSSRVGHRKLCGPGAGDQRHAIGHAAHVFDPQRHWNEFRFGQHGRRVQRNGDADLRDQPRDGIPEEVAELGQEAARQEAGALVRRSPPEAMADGNEL